MTDVKTLDWKFLDFNQTQWVELWSSGTKPNLVEFDMQPSGDLIGTTMDFWVPKIDPVATGVAGSGSRSSSGGNGEGINRLRTPQRRQRERHNRRAGWRGSPGTESGDAMMRAGDFGLKGSRRRPCAGTVAERNRGGSRLENKRYF